MSKDKSNSDIILGFSILSKHIENIVFSFFSKEVIKELMRIFMISKLIVVARVELLFFSFSNVHYF